MQWKASASDGSDDFGHIICRRCPRPWVVAQRNSLFREAFAPFFYCNEDERFCPTHQLKLGDDGRSRDAFDCEASNDRSLFHEYPKRTSYSWLFRNGVNVNPNGRTRTFKGQIGGVEIISLEISFILISAIPG
jgi:hypothetical protein